MPTVNANSEVSIGGLTFFSKQSIIGSHVSVIDSTYDILNTSSTIPIYAESDVAGDIKLIAFKSSIDLDLVRLVDGAGTTVVDIMGAAVSSGNILANQAYILPGTALLPTVSNVNDVEHLQVSALSTTAGVRIQCAILFDADTTDTIVM